MDNENTEGSEDDKDVNIVSNLYCFGLNFCARIY